MKNKANKIQKRFITLIEIMIVMFLIALITGVVAYNYRGSLDEGKAFKTRTAIERVETLLNLRAAENSDVLNNISGEWKEMIRNSPLVSNPDALIRDGWGNEFEVNVDERGAVRVRSAKYDEYVRSHQTMFGDEKRER